ncbi:S9 family peptidase [Myroides sp. LJL119]
MKATVFLSIIISLFSLNTKSQTDSIRIDEKWFTLLPHSISPDGKWISYIKQYETGSTRKLKYFFFDIQNNIEHELINQNNSPTTLLTENLALIQKDNSLQVYNLKEQKIISNINNVKKFNIDINTNQIFILGHDKKLQIANFKKIDSNYIIEDIVNYVLSPDNRYLLYINKDNKLFSVNTITKEKKRYKPFIHDFTFIKWNLQQNVIAFLNKDNFLQLLNLQTNEMAIINSQLDNAKNLEVNFSINNDLFIKYETYIPKSPQYKTYLEILGVNSKEPMPYYFQNNFTLKKEALVYKYDTKSMIKMERNDKKEYLSINFPDHVIYYDKLQFKDFLNQLYNINYRLFNIQTKESYDLTTQKSVIITPSKDGKFIFYPTTNPNNWELLNIQTKQKFTLRTTSASGGLVPHWSIDSKSIYFQRDNKLIEFNIESLTFKVLKVFPKNTSLRLITNTLENNRSSSSKQYVNTKANIFIKTKTNQKEAIYKFSNGKIVLLRLPTSNRILNIRVDHSQNNISWIEENFNLPPTIMVYTDSLFSIKNNLDKELYDWQYQKSIVYKDTNGVALEGILYYPKNFNKNKKYPLITYIYEEVRSSPLLQPNAFIVPTLLNTHGHNRTLLTEQGYFVFTPDTYIGNEGPGLTAVNCVVQGVQEVLAVEPAIDNSKIGLSGFSFGGYKASLIGAYTNLFSAIISISARHDLLSYYMQLDGEKEPGFTRLENGQFKLIENYAQNPTKYIANSPLLQAQNINTPMLIVAGLNDTNVSAQHTRSMYWALKRYEKFQSVALFYNKVGHGFRIYDQDKEATDFTIRYIQWFDYFLKEKKNIPWIKENTSASTEK